MKECDVRKFLRRLFGTDRLIWVEYNFGGTDGAPDVFVLTFGRFSGLELKIAELVGDDLVFLLRPSQVAVHRRLNKASGRTWILLGYGGCFYLIKAAGGTFLSDYEPIQNGKKLEFRVPITKFVKFEGRNWGELRDRFVLEIS